MHEELKVHFEILQIVYNPLRTILLKHEEMEYVLKLHIHPMAILMCTLYNIFSYCYFYMHVSYSRAVPWFHFILMITIYGKDKCSLLVLEYITNPFLALLHGFNQYETERLQYVDLAYIAMPQMQSTKNTYTKSSLPLILQHKLMLFIKITCIC